MPIRTDETKVKNLVETQAGESVQWAIDDASLIVDEVLGTSSLTAGRLELIERYLAAHFWVLAKEKGGLTSEKALDATNTYRKFDGAGLSATRFGEQVAVYDTTGELDKVLSFKKTAQFRLV